MPKGSYNGPYKRTGKDTYSYKKNSKQSIDYTNEYSAKPRAPLGVGNVETYDYGSGQSVNRKKKTSKAKY